MVHGLTPARKLQPSGSQLAGANAITAPFLIGHGYDIHRLQPAAEGRKLVLAGVTVSEDISPIAHSDGDVVLHAIVDALLGATGQGDIGQHFSDADPRWKGADSSVFVNEVLARVRRGGYRVCNVDVTLLLERPKLGALRKRMTDNLRRLLSPVSVVNVKAGTNEGCDAVGRGEAVAAHAVVLLVADSQA